MKLRTLLFASLIIALSLYFAPSMMAVQSSDNEAKIVKRHEAKQNTVKNQKRNRRAQAKQAKRDKRAERRGKHVGQPKSHQVQPKANKEAAK